MFSILKLKNKNGGGKSHTHLSFNGRWSANTYDDYIKRIKIFTIPYLIVCWSEWVVS